MSLKYEKFILDSSKRRSDATPSEYELTFSKENYKYKSMRISQLMVPYSAYSVNSNNNRIIFDEGAGSLVAIITEGNYTPTELIAEIKIRMDASGGVTYTVTYDSITNKITVSASAGTFKYQLSNPTFTAFNLLGYIGNTTDPAFAASQTSSTVINLSGTSYYRLYIDKLDIDFIGGTVDDSTKYSAIFPVTASGYNSTMVYDFQEIKHLTVSKNTTHEFNNIRIRWYDDQGNLVDFNGVNNWIEIELNF